MNAQLSQVFRTYSRRPLVKLFAALALLIAIGLYAMGFVPESANVPIAPEIELTGNSAWLTAREWDEYFREHDTSDLTSLDLTYFSLAPFPDLTALENLTTLKLDSSDFTREKLKEVASPESLESLALQAPSIPKGTWTVLGPKLRELEIPLRLLLSRPDEVSQLVELRMLRIDRTRLTPEALAVIATIPNLEYLVLSLNLTDDYEEEGPPPPPLSSVALPPATLSPLAGHPGLEAIFVHWPPHTPRTTPTLPGVQLYPAGSPSAWPGAIMLGLFFTGAIAAIVAVQSWVHFVVQTAAVIPGYARPHRLAAIFVLLGGSLVGAIGVWLSEIAILSASVIVLAFPTALLTTITAPLSPSRIVRTLGPFLAVLAVVLFWFPMALPFTLSPVMAGEIVWFLRGEFPLITLLILLSECALLAWAFVLLPRLVRHAYEKSALRPGLSPWDPQQARRTYETQNWYMRLVDRKESYDRLRGDSIWQKARLWQAGNAFRPRNALRFAGLYILFFVVLQMLMRGEEGLSDPSMWSGCLAQLGGMALLIPPAIWHRRCGSLPVESLRPVGRRDLVRQLFTALALDQSLALVPFTIAMAWSIAFSREGGSVAESYSFIAAAMVAFVWIYALSTGVFAFKRTWVLLGYIVGMIALPVASLSAIAIIAETMKMPAGPQILLIYIESVAFLVLAAGILAATYHRSLRREWG